MIVEIDDEFDLKKILQSGQCFRVIPLDRSYIFVYKDKLVQITQISTNTWDVSCSKDQWDNFWLYYFNFDKNYEKIYPPIKDEFMVDAINAAKGIRILRQDPWETLISFIISQRKNITSIQKCINSICVKYGKKISNTTLECLDGKLNHLYSFPDPMSLLQMKDYPSNNFGLGYRFPYLIDAANAVISGKVDLKYAEKLCDEDLIEYFMQIKGVGIKVASCVALFAYGRHNVSPIDTWINKIIMKYYDNVNPFNCENGGIYQQYAFYYIRKLNDRL